MIFEKRAMWFKAAIDDAIQRMGGDAKPDWRTKSLLYADRNAEGALPPRRERKPEEPKQ
ncbi:hypothetical protein GCM10009106_27660 [Sphingomonas japonica]